MLNVLSKERFPLPSKQASPGHDWRKGEGTPHPKRNSRPSRCSGGVNQRVSVMSYSCSAISIGGCSGVSYASKVSSSFSSSTATSTVDPAV